MALNDDEIDSALAAVIALYYDSSSDDDDEDLQYSSRRRSVWTKNWLLKRGTEGFGAKLFKELQEEEPALHHNFLRMTNDQFQHLLRLVTPYIEKQNTVMRESITSSDRLSCTLRFLSTGESYSSLRYLYRISTSAISIFIPEVLDAIYKVLVDDYLKVRCSIDVIQISIKFDFNCFYSDAVYRIRVGTNCREVQ